MGEFVKQFNKILNILKFLEKQNKRYNKNNCNFKFNKVYIENWQYLITLYCEINKQNL